MHEIYCLIVGRVQGVAYRSYAQDVATELRVFGYTRNLPDGRVEIIAQGEAGKLKEFIEYMNEGSSLSSVEGVAVEWGTSREVYSDFTIRY